MAHRAWSLLGMTTLTSARSTDPRRASYPDDLPLLAGLAADEPLDHPGAVCGGAAFDVDAPSIAHVDEPVVSAGRRRDQFPPLVGSTVLGPLDECRALA